MKKSTRIALVVTAVTIIAIVISAIVLPDSVRVQGSVKTGMTTYLPKLWAIVLAAVLSAAGVLGVLFSRKEEPQKYYPLIVSVIGILLFLYMIVANCIFA